MRMAVPFHILRFGRTVQDRGSVTWGRGSRSPDHSRLQPRTKRITGGGDVHITNRASWRDNLVDSPQAPLLPSVLIDPLMICWSTTAWPWVAFLILILLAAAGRQRRKRRRLPPGPPPLPIVGNVFYFPRKHLSREFAALSQRFGPFSVIHMYMWCVYAR